ncbi:MAG: COG1361 S-layer family protein [Eisenbergiella sp.]
MNKLGKKLLVCGMAALMAGASFYTPMTVYADVSGNDVEYIDDDMRWEASAELKNYKESLIKRENPEQYIIDELDDIMYSGLYYIANSEKMTESEMWDYVGKVKAEMDSAIGKSGEVTTTSEFLTVANNWATPTVSYGQTVDIVLPLINMGEEWLTDLLVEPVISNDVKEWPFKPDSTGYTQNFNEIPGCATKLYEEAVFNRRELTWTFTAREDVLTGYYPLKFKVWYSKEGIRCKEPVEITVYVYCQGKPGSGRIGMSEETNVSQPRIIVTGFETEPKEVYAGDIFTLTVHVKNTSPDTAVNNVLFDLQAVEGGTETSTGQITNSYASFLPTSGSSSIYVERMAAGSSQDLKIEMQAKADLSQKPYVVTVKMKYDTDLKADLTDEAKVSIPVKQESKYDTSTPEVNPASIMTGEQSNVMFQIYNTGKTTLYNVQVKFEADSVEGGDTFIGNLEPGATGNVDAMVTGKAATMDDGTVKAVITYEDDAGNQTREELNVNIMVSDMPMDAGMEMEPMLPEEPEDEGMGAGMIAAIAVGVIAAAGIAAALILKLRKKKKVAKLLAEDLMDLDQKDR